MRPDRSRVSSVTVIGPITEHQDGDVRFNFLQPIGEKSDLRLGSGLFGLVLLNFSFTADIYSVAVRDSQTVEEKRW